MLLRRLPEYAANSAVSYPGGQFLVRSGHRALPRRRDELRPIASSLIRWRASLRGTGRRAGRPLGLSLLEEGPNALLGLLRDEGLGRDGGVAAEIERTA